MTPPTTAAEVQACYREHRALHQRLYDAIARRGANARKALVFPAALILEATFHSQRSSSSWLFAIGIPTLVALLWYSTRQQTRLAREQRLLVFHDRNLARADGSEPQSGRTGLEPGQELRTPAHLYDRDLDILGPDSLFGLLATTRTGPGERGLAATSSNPPPTTRPCSASRPSASSPRRLLSANTSPSSEPPASTRFPPAFSTPG